MGEEHGILTNQDKELKNMGYSSIKARKKHGWHGE